MTAASAPQEPVTDAEPSGDPLRVVVAKVGFDGHDRGIRVVARTLRDAGIEVVYLGLRQTVEALVAAARDEDASVIGVSIHNGGHRTIAPRVVQAVRDAGLDVAVIVGGIVPQADEVELREAGVAAILGPGASADEVVSAVRAAGRAVRSGRGR